jgi:hypothetical protein
MTKEKRDFWFPAKKYGFGWGAPITWQGWVVLLVYLLLIIVGSKMIVSSPTGMMWFLPYVIPLTVLFIFICWKKGEKAAWRWGRKEDMDQD